MPEHRKKETKNIMKINLNTVAVTEIEDQFDDMELSELRTVRAHRNSRVADGQFRSRESDRREWQQQRNAARRNSERNTVAGAL